VQARTARRRLEAAQAVAAEEVRSCRAECAADVARVGRLAAVLTAVLRQVAPGLQLPSLAEQDAQGYGVMAARNSDPGGQPGRTSNSRLVQQHADVMADDRFEIDHVQSSIAPRAHAARDLAWAEPARTQVQPAPQPLPPPGLRSRSRSPVGDVNEAGCAPTFTDLMTSLNVLQSQLQLRCHSRTPPSCHGDSAPFRPFQTAATPAVAADVLGCASQTPRAYTSEASRSSAAVQSSLQRRNSEGVHSEALRQSASGRVWPRPASYAAQQHTRRQRQQEQLLSSCQHAATDPAQPRSAQAAFLRSSLRRPVWRSSGAGCTPAAPAWSSGSLTARSHRSEYSACDQAELDPRSAAAVRTALPARPPSMNFASGMQAHVHSGSAERPGAAAAPQPVRSCFSVQLCPASATSDPALGSPASNVAPAHSGHTPGAGKGLGLGGMVSPISPGDQPAAAQPASLQPAPAPRHDHQVVPLALLAPELESCSSQQAPSSPCLSSQRKQSDQLEGLDGDLAGDQPGQEHTAAHVLGAAPNTDAGSGGSTKAGVDGTGPPSPSSQHAAAGEGLMPPPPPRDATADARILASKMQADHLQTGIGEAAADVDASDEAPARARSASIARLKARMRQRSSSGQLRASAASRQDSRASSCQSLQGAQLPLRGQPVGCEPAIDGRAGADALDGISAAQSRAAADLDLSPFGVHLSPCASHCGAHPCHEQSDSGCRYACAARASDGSSCVLLGTASFAPDPVATTAMPERSPPNLITVTPDAAAVQAQGGASEDVWADENGNRLSQQQESSPVATAARCARAHDASGADIWGAAASGKQQAQMRAGATLGMLAEMPLEALLNECCSPVSL
jgi:hypothetical protein